MLCGLLRACRNGEGDRDRRSAGQSGEAHSGKEGNASDRSEAGGRCRSYYDHTTSMVIDNGTHLLLSGNHAALNYLKTIGAETMLEGPADAEFQFIDLAGGARWTVRFNNGLFPWWIFDKDSSLRPRRS